MIDRLLSLLAPHICCNCRNVGGLLCLSCENDIVEDGFSQCVSCLVPTASSNLCKSCQTRTPFADAYVSGVRHAALKELLDVYKFERGYEASRILARILDESLPYFDPSTVIVPVPTIGKHRRVRGYDHVGLIARHLARRRKLAVGSLLVRRDSYVQHGASRDVRTTQAAEMFERRGSAPECPILLLDDIYTTGATVTAAAHLLAAETRAPIYLGIIARQPLDDSGDLW